MKNNPAGESDHKCVFIQLPFTHNTLLVDVFWPLVSAQRSGHHHASTHEQKKQKLCVQFPYIFCPCAEPSCRKTFTSTSQCVTDN